jgi:hypothetical protein
LPASPNLAKRLDCGCFSTAFSRLAKSEISNEIGQRKMIPPFMVQAAGPTFSELNPGKRI